MPNLKLYAMVVKLSPVLRYLKCTCTTHEMSVFVAKWNPDDYRWLCYICNTDLTDDLRPDGKHHLYDYHMRLCFQYWPNRDRAVENFGSFVSLRVNSSNSDLWTFECLKCVWEKYDGKSSCVYEARNYDAVIRHFAGVHAHIMATSDDERFQ